MPWLPMYINKADTTLILDLLNSDSNIAFIVSAGKKRWKASHRIETLNDGRYCIWHILSGDLPLLGKLFGDGIVKDPWAGWKEKRTGADPTQPFFGPGHPGIIWLNVLTSSIKEKDLVGLSSFEWIGNHFKMSGIEASDSTKKWWVNLKKSIKKLSVSLPRKDNSGLKNEIYTLPGAKFDFDSGKGRAINPEPIDFS